LISSKTLSKMLDVVSSNGASLERYRLNPLTSLGAITLIEQIKEIESVLKDSLENSLSNRENLTLLECNQISLMNKEYLNQSRSVISLMHQENLQSSQLLYKFQLLADEGNANG
jgi:hypothetical protein